MSFEAFREWWSDIFWENRSVIRTITTIKASGVRLVLVSNTNSLHFENIKEHYPDVIALFDDIVLSYEKRASKQDGSLLKVALEVSQVLAGECLYIDDIPKYVQAAHNLGMNGLLYRSYPRFVRDLRDFGLYVS
jgi:HAD superfamily hydrolase (TIGR01509 family)